MSVKKLTLKLMQKIINYFLHFKRDNKAQALLNEVRLLDKHYFERVKNKELKYEKV